MKEGKNSPQTTGMRRDWMIKPDEVAAMLRPRKCLLVLTLRECFPRSAAKRRIDFTKASPIFPKAADDGIGNSFCQRRNVHT